MTNQPNDLNLSKTLVANGELIFNLIRAIKRGIDPSSLILDFGYSRGDVEIALRCISYIEACYKNKLIKEVVF